jgi:hypothetical protein
VILVRSLFKLGALCVFATVFASGQSRLVIDSDDFRYTAAFHPARISEGRLRELLLFSPYEFDGSGLEIDHIPVMMGFEETPKRLRKGPLAYSLEFCVDSDPRYRPCGTRDISDPNFLANAQINVDRNEQILAALNRLDVPVELTSILQQFRDSMTFYSTIERRRLEYLQTGDPQVLSQTVVTLDPLKTCSKEIEELKKAAALRRRYELSRKEWPNCLNLEWGRISPAYPHEAWARFLRAYGVSERYMYKPVD